MPAEFIKGHKAGRIFNSYRDAIAQIRKDRPNLPIDPLPKLTAFVESQLDTLDPDLVTAGQIPPLQAHFSSALNEANALNGDGSTAHIEQIRNHLAAAITILATLPKVTAPEDIQAAYSSVLEHTRSTSTGILQDVTRNVGELTSVANATNEPARESRRLRVVSQATMADSRCR
jgi:hypothetical protein